MMEPPTPVGAETQHLPVLGLPAVQRDDFDAFYTREVRAVSVFLMHQGATPYEAADAAHEAISKLLPDQWRTVEYPRAWLRVTAQRYYWRQNDRRVSPTDAVPDRPGGTCPVSEVVLTETQRRITDALHRLTSAQRTVMAWRLDGFDYSEIARALDMTPEAVRQNISRARKNLISILDLSKGDAHE
ncbi:sigma-70 family RNA polymerase sigma factor [Streptomyces mirabilis]|uniref:RNA polymerase sigma factor n=1 Tax=Streptomyces mirabilis TaxID=68239 RepID=UPI0021C07C06|nr:sigma-70 family RNA polymerase sigma factor [Streptomyces mirabilis]MCT9113009.1 sigma-70 family RNA polymerase sigma factor [Streptomyces mirabilis]